MASVAGVDGCRGGWIVVTDSRAFVCPDFAAVLDDLDDDTVIGVDIPIGLYDEHVIGGREADRAARTRLGSKSSSVFSAPPRAAFGASSLPEAQRRGCRLTLQTLHITPKAADVDRVMTPALQRRVFEVHPELCFLAMRGRHLPPKRSLAGRTERQAALAHAGVAVPARPPGAAEDDLLDACATRWGAARAVAGAGERVPACPPVDSRGLRMEIRW
jgi:predicted RNase H-like nuclease